MILLDSIPDENIVDMNICRLVHIWKFSRTNLKIFPDKSENFLRQIWKFSRTNLKMLSSLSSISSSSLLSSLSSISFSSLLSSLSSTSSLCRCCPPPPPPPRCCCRRRRRCSPPPRCCCRRRRRRRRSHPPRCCCRRRRRCSPPPRCCCRRRRRRSPPPRCCWCCLKFVFSFFCGNCRHLVMKFLLEKYQCPCLRNMYLRRNESAFLWQRTDRQRTEDRIGYSRKLDCWGHKASMLGPQGLTRATRPNYLQHFFERKCWFWDKFFGHSRGNSWHFLVIYSCPWYILGMQCIGEVQTRIFPAIKESESC